MISSDSMRGFNDLLILIILKKNDSYGYEISKTIENLSKGTYKLKETTLYSAIKRLEKNKFIKPYDTEETFGRKRTNYTITPLGQREVDKKTEEFKEISQLINNFLKY